MATHIARWDLDKTYLRTEFDSLRDLVKTALERPDQKPQEVRKANIPIEPGERYAQDGRQLDADGKPLSRWRRWWHMLPGTSPAPQ